MTDSLQSFNKGLMQFLERSPTPFHAVSEAVRLLEQDGFEELKEGEVWALKPDGRYVVRRNGSALVAFTGACADQSRVLNGGIRFFGAHSDSPCLRVKPNPNLSRQGCLQLGVEPYGGLLMAPWFDRDLSLAGRVVFQRSGAELESVLLNWKAPIAFIPSLAIHLDRKANKDRSINPQTELPPVLALIQDEEAQTLKDLIKAQILDEHGIAAEQVLDYELSLYDTQAPALVGLKQEFLCSARLDNLLSCYIGLAALKAGDGKQPVMLVLNDHEEVGSASAEGACGPFLRSVLQRVVSDREEERARCLNRSLLISADNAHAIHPNFADRHDDKHGPRLNAGPVIKVNSNQRYATNSVTAAFYRQLSESLDLPVQVFVTRSDLGCGSTIGPLTATELGVKTLDIGVPQWGMHSIRETCGSEDPYTLFQVSRAFFDSEKLPVT